MPDELEAPRAEIRRLKAENFRLKEDVAALEGRLACAELLIAQIRAQFPTRLGT
jgi:hypothetical protein